MLSRLSLKVFDCYRPTMAVDEFFTWSLLPQQQEMKAEFYPNVDKKDFFKLGYVAEKSGHSRGSTVDLAIVPLGGHSDTYVPQQALQSCTQPYQLRFLTVCLTLEQDMIVWTHFRTVTQRSVLLRALIAQCCETSWINTALTLIQKNGGISRCAMSHFQRLTLISQ